MGTASLSSPLDRVAHLFFASLVPTSNLMFFLDVSPEVAFKRIRMTRERREMFESLEELRRIRKKALSLALLGRWRVVDSNKAVEDLGNEIIESLRLDACSYRYHIQSRDDTRCDTRPIASISVT